LAAGVSGAIAEATAHTSKSHAVNQHGRWAIVKSNAGTGPPQKGKYQDYAGTLSGPPGGKGAIIFDQVFASQFNGQSVSITGTATFFEPKGSYSGATSGTNGAHGPNATVKITKGFGLYKGATGKVAITGPACPITAPCSITITGSIKY
jgi:hypothetical protein